MTTHLSDRATWLAARKELLALEKAHARRGDELAQQRRALPWVEVHDDYAFETIHGHGSLESLFGTASQLVVYHFMFAQDWDKPCPSCSFWADHFDGVVGHLANRDVALAVVSKAPVATLSAWAARAGWSFPWVSSHGNTFNEDFGVTLDGHSEYNYAPSTSTGEMPGLSVFARREGKVFHTYSAYARGLEPMNSTYGILDLVPKGRDEGGLEWSMAWVKRLAEAG